MFNRNHYVQKKLLKNFANQAGNSKYKICVLDLINFSVDYRNVDSAFYERDIYDVHTSVDLKELEKKFSEIIERPMVEIFDRICNSADKVTFTRKELYVIKKYFLLQHYRTPRDKANYTKKREGFRFSQYNIKENESEEDFWKREMLTILDSNWVNLMNSEMVGVRSNAIKTNSTFIMIIRTDSEFCINDLGYVTERVPIQMQDEQEYIEAAKSIGQKLFGMDNFDEVMGMRMENKINFLDNFELYPISPKVAVLFVSPVWKIALFDENVVGKMSLFSPILMKYLRFPKNEYIKEDKIKTQKDFIKYIDDNDRYIYSVQKITEKETIYLNTLLMNEAYCYVGVKNPLKFIPSIKEYNYLMSIGQKNLRHNYNGYVELLSHLNDIKGQ